MTRVSVKTARRGARRVAGPLIGGLFALTLAACSSGSITSDAGPTAALAPQQIQTKPVAFAPVIGAPAKVSTKLSELLVAQAGQKSIPVVPPKDADYTIRGYLVAAPDPKGTKLSYIWDVSDKTNKRKRIQGDELIEGKKGGDPWAVVDDAAMQRVATKALDEISAWLPKAEPGESVPVASGADQAKPVEPVKVAAAAPAPAEKPDTPVVSATAQSEPAPKPQPVAASARERPTATGAVLAAQTAQPSPSASVPAVAVVPAVSGAPGDGGQSLTSAMRKHLQQAGVKLAEGSAGTNAYTVKGSVEMGGAVDGQQPITIQWTVLDPSGKRLDKAVVQHNKVAQGSLDGPWGQIADLAAGEAAKSIAKLIGKPAG